MKADRERLWQLVDDALDARRDPRKNREVQRLLFEDLEAHAELERALGTIGALESCRVAPIVRPISAAAMLIAMAAGVIGQFLGGSDDVQASLRALAATRIEPDPRSCVLSLRIESTLEQPGASGRQAIDAFASTRIEESTLSAGAPLAKAISIGPTTITRRLERGL